MTREELEQIQQQAAAHDMFSLAMMCRRRFLRSAQLVEQSGEVIAGLPRFGTVDRVDLELLLPAWRTICERYIHERWSPQLPFMLLVDYDPPTLWARFVHSRLLPALVREDEVVRNVLRALGGLPSEDRREAAEGLQRYLAKMTLPGSSSPWAADEQLDV